jgi:primosomal protein N' (replication factor Y)
VAAEMAHRRQHNYPPYQRLARIIVRSRDQQAASSFADLLADAFQRTLQTMAEQAPPEVRVLGPAEAPVFRLKGYYRFHFQLQSPSPATLHQVLRAVLPAQRAPAGVEFTLDVDPFNML